MKTFSARRLAAALALAWGLWSAVPALALEPVSPAAVLPQPGMVTMVDVGAAKCIPCKMMAPILEELAKEYQGRALIAFVDVRLHPQMNDRFKARGIPTQIFYDREGREVSRHLGFLDKASIVKELSRLGVN